MYQHAIQIRSLKMTHDIGKIMGQNLNQGDIVLFSGNLGAGKTTLIKSICSAMGIDNNIVISPTYTMVNIYYGKQMVFHVDLFRLTDVGDLDNFDMEDLICSEGITLVEWPNLLKSILTDEIFLSVNIKTNEDESRMIEFSSPFKEFVPLFDYLGRL